MRNRPFSPKNVTADSEPPSITPWLVIRMSSPPATIAFSAFVARIAPLARLVIVVPSPRATVMASPRPPPMLMIPVLTISEPAPVAWTANCRLPASAGTELGYGENTKVIAPLLVSVLLSRIDTAPPDGDLRWILPSFRMVVPAAVLTADVVGREGGTELVSGVGERSTLSISPRLTSVSPVAGTAPLRAPWTTGRDPSTDKKPSFTRRPPGPVKTIRPGPPPGPRTSPPASMVALPPGPKNSAATLLPSLRPVPGATSFAPRLIRASKPFAGTSFFWTGIPGRPSKPCKRRPVSQTTAPPDGTASTRSGLAFVPLTVQLADADDTAAMVRTPAPNSAKALVER